MSNLLKEDVKVIPDIDSRCAGWRRPPGTKISLRPRKGEAGNIDRMVTAIKGILQQMSSASFYGRSKHRGDSSTPGATTKAVEKRRARNKMARRSRRVNMLYA